jgi:hypothetical protein
MTVIATPIVTNVIKFVECCTGAEIFFRGSIPVIDNVTYFFAGATPFPGTGGVLMPDTCYTAYNLYVDNAVYPFPPAISQFINTKIGCTDLMCPSCTPIVILPCYMIIPCDGTAPIVSNNQDFADTVNTFAEVFSTLYAGCAYIVELTDNDCEDAIDVVLVDKVCTAICDVKCYYVDNSNGVLYVDADGALQQLSALEAKPYVKICSSVYPVVDISSDNYQIIDLGLCDVDGCPQLCFKLTNCDTEEVIYTNSDSVLPYLYSPNAVVKVLGKEGCWTISNLERGELCDCPIDVVIVSSYIDCPACLGYTSYKLTSCDSTDVIYTLDDLSQYLTQTIKLNCGCYTIEQLDVLPPNVQSVYVEDTFKSCTECLRTYWKLTDCTGVANDIYTYSDLAEYDGGIIKIENCDTCWRVLPTTEHINPTTVTVVESFKECIDCIENLLPCQCSTISNYSIYTKKYDYLDCEFNQGTITLESGETSERMCVLYWYPNVYCDCFLIELRVEITIGDFQYFIFKAESNGTLLNGFPVYTVCPPFSTCGTVSFDGTTWVLYDNLGVATFILSDLTSTSCPFGTWLDPNGEPIDNTVISSYACPDRCTCINLEVNESGTIIDYTLPIEDYDNNGNPIYSDGTVSLTYDTDSNCWGIYYGSSQFPTATMCGMLTASCPLGIFVGQSTTTYVTTDCTVTPLPPALEATDIVKYFGLCQQGVCPPPVFVNNRTVRPGYNTPICTPAKYDAITCSFADAMYRLVLEKRYGITNCCAEENENAIVQKELIDLQALRDPNYKCPDCPCPCNSGKTCSTCKCGN